MNRQSFTHSGIRYTASGQGHPLVLLHGHTLDGRMWEPQLEALEPRFQVIRPDLRGYGGSDLPGPTPFLYADDLLELLDHLGAGQAHLLGLSLGGNVALDFAIHHPQRVGRLVLAASSLKGFPPLPEAAALLAAIPAKAQASGVAAARALWLAHPFFAPALRSPAVGERLSAIVGDYSGFHWSTGYPPSQPINTVVDRLGEVQAQTLVLVGELDTPQNRLVADHLAAHIPEARKLLLEGAGHMLNLEAPEGFNRAVVGFLEAAEG